MAGARLVLNSRFFHIARAGEKADGKHSMTKEAAMGLVNYVGTREGVELNVPDQMSLNGDNPSQLNLEPLHLSPDIAAKPTTMKQLDTIADLLSTIPEAKNTLEYQDFKAHPTIENASELISRAAELGLGYASDINTAINLVEYVGKRPGVDRVGEHGLFSSSPNVDLHKAQEEVANCKGNIWTHVISLRREDADMLGYNQQKPWRDLVMQKIDVIAKSSNIPVSQLHWYAGMHNTSHHPHIHLFVFSDDPKAGHLSVKGINEMKSAFSEVIFADERKHIYIHKDEMYEKIKLTIDEILSNLEASENNQFSKPDLDALCKKFVTLAGDLKNHSGKMQFGWLKDSNIRNQVNDIMCDLAEAPDIQKLYGLYCDDHQALQKMYRNDPSDVGPIVKNAKFRDIKNKIIREAIRLNNTIPNTERDSQVPSLSRPETDEQTMKQDNSISKELPDNKNSSSILEEVHPAQSNLSYDFEENDSNDFVIEKSDRFSDDENLSSLFNNIPPEPESSAPDENYQPADEIFEQEKIVEVHKSNKKPDFKEVYMKACDGDVKSRYKLARMYFYGNGIEQNYIEAQVWYGLAAEDGHYLAAYELGKMYLYGIGIDKDDDLGKEYCLKAYYGIIDELQKYTSIENLLGDDHNYLCNIEKFDSYHAYLEYLVGRMRLAGEGVNHDSSDAKVWFNAAALHGHVHSEYMLGKLYYDGNGCEQSYCEAASLYRGAADKCDKYASYAAGRMFYRGTGVKQDFSTAASYFVKASRENVPYADYALAQMSELGEGMEQPDEAGAQTFYKKALDEFIAQEKQQPDPLTECRIAKMYLSGKGVDVNSTESAKWFAKAVESGSPQAEYELAQLYLSGDGVPVDKNKAAELFKKALAAFISSDKDNPSAGQEYRIACMYEKGLGTDISIPDTIKWLSTAAENGHGHAAYRLGKFYSDGKAVPQDDSTALKCYLRAAELQNKFSYYALGQIYYNGTGVDQDFSQAAEWFKKASDQNLSYADYKLASMYASGLGMKANPELAQSLYNKALKGFTEQEKENPDVQTEYRIGSMYFAGKGTDVSFESAIDWFTKAADNGYPMAGYQLAKMFLEGKGVIANQSKAAELFQKSLAAFIDSDENNPNANQEYRIGNMYLRGNGTDVNPGNALHWLIQSAKNGNMFAAYQAAQLLFDGNSVTPDTENAQKLYANALAGFLLLEKDKPDPQTEYRIGKMYLNGQGTNLNPEIALRWFSLSAGKGNAFAAYRAAHILEQGKGIIPNIARAQIFYNLALNGFIKIEHEQPSKFLELSIAQMFLSGKGAQCNQSAAFQWFLLCADKGNANAQFQAAKMLQNGQGAQKDEQKAQLYYTKALKAFLSDLRSTPDSALQYKIGTMYEFGQGVDRNIAIAKEWYTEAVQAGNQNAANRLNQIESAETQQAANSIMGLFRFFARFLGHNVEDSTTHKYRQDRKLLQKQKMLHSQQHDQEQIM